jgi:BlaI family transcriptional regulator, penicillinase repressor
MTNSMKSAPKISDTEWEVMRVVWARHPIAASEVIKLLSAGDPSWHPKTVRTLLTRLVRKKALRYESANRAYLYRPLVAKQECVNTASESFLGRVFGGSLNPMLAHFVGSGRLTKKELDELRKLLDSKPGGKT